MFTAGRQTGPCRPLNGCMQPRTTLFGPAGGALLAMCPPPAMPSPPSCPLARRQHIPLPLCRGLCAVSRPRHAGGACFSGLFHTSATDLIFIPPGVHCPCGGALQCSYSAAHPAVWHWGRLAAQQGCAWLAGGGHRWGSTCAQLPPRAAPSPPQLPLRKRKRGMGAGAEEEEEVDFVQPEKVGGHPLNCAALQGQRGGSTWWGGRVLI